MTNQKTAQLQLTFSPAIEQLGVGSGTGCFICNGKTFISDTVPVEKRQKPHSLYAHAKNRECYGCLVMVINFMIKHTGISGEIFPTNAMLEMEN